MGIEWSTQGFGGIAEQTEEPDFELIDIGFDQVGPVVVGLLDLVADAQAALQLLQDEVLFPLVVNVEFDRGGGVVVLLPTALLLLLRVVQGRNVNVNVYHFRTDFVLDALDRDVVVVGDEQLRRYVENEYFVDLAVRCQFVQQFADVGGAGQDFLHHTAECLKHGQIQDGSEVQVHHFIVHTLVS